MKNTEVIRHLEKLRRIKRKKHHELIHKIHKEHGISKKTLFYVKEYGPHSHIAKTIIRESIKILLFASIISSLGGLMLEHIKETFVEIIPLIILLPGLNNMIGSYGTIISSRFSTMLHEGKIKSKWWKNKEVMHIFAQISVISLLTAALSLALSFAISGFSDYNLSMTIALKIFLIVIMDNILLVSILFLTAVFAGTYFFKKQEDPNNFLIPITTSVADFGNMAILALLVVLFL